MGSELGRLRSGQQTQTDMTEEQLGEYASKTNDAKGNLDPLVLILIATYEMWS